MVDFLTKLCVVGKRRRKQFEFLKDLECSFLKENILSQIIVNYKLRSDLSHHT